MKDRPDKITLFDRIAVAFLSAILAFATGIVLLILITLTGAGFLFPQSINPLTLILIFSSIMASIGFIANTNYIAMVFGKIWHFIYKVFQASA